VIKRVLARTERALRSYRAKRLGLKEVEPNYGFIERFAPGEAAIDIGVGDDPDFSLYLINNYQMECFAVDPTRKHAPSLQAIERETKNFHYLPLALGAENKTVEFNESTINVSGSLLKGHSNIQNDPCISYEVQMVTLDSLLEQVGKESISILKMDTEGAEYETIDSLKAADLKRIRQLMIEFHHDRVEGITWPDTQRAIRTLEKHGMKSFLYNGRDCLFYW